MSCSWIKIYDSPIGGNVIQEDEIYTGQTVYFDISDIPEGYRFIGWTDENGNLLNETVIRLVSENRYETRFACDNTFVAHIEEIQEIQCLTTVECDETMGTVSITGNNDVCGSIVTITAEPNCCHRFLTWSDVGSDRMNSIRNVTVLDGNNIYVAVFEPKDFSFSAGVNYNIMGSVYVHNGRPFVHCGDTITFEARPNLGYEFVKWEPDDDRQPIKTITYNCLTPIYKAIFTQKAVSRLSYSIGATEILNGGEYMVDDMITYPNTTKGGYNFLGWAIDPSSTIPDYIPGSTSVVTEVSDVILYAVFSEYEERQITYKGLPDDSEHVYCSETYRYMDTITLFTPNAVFGYNFIGWNISIVSSSNVIDNNVVGKYVMPNFDIVANAIWDRGGISYHTIKYVYNNNTNDFSIVCGIVSGSNHIVKDAESMRLTYQGHTFLNWTDGLNIYDEGSQIYSVSYDMELRANWVETAKYTITYILTSAHIINPIVETVYVGDSIILLDGGDLTKDGYTFCGWASTKNAQIPQYYPSQYITPTGDMTLYCVWKPIPKLTVNYHVMDGCYDVIDRNEYVYGDIVTVNGFICESSDTTVCKMWNTMQDGSGVVFEPGDVFAITENMDLFQVCPDCYATFITNNQNSVLTVNENVVSWGSTVSITNSFEFNVEPPTGNIFSGLFNVDEHSYLVPYNCFGEIRYRIIPNQYNDRINPDKIRVYNNADYITEIDTRQDFDNNRPFIKNSDTNEVRQGIPSCNNEIYDIQCGTNLMAVIEPVT